MDSLAAFVRGLAESGRVRIDLRAALEPADVNAATERALDDAALVELDALAREEAPAKAPELRIDDARFAARLLREACRLSVDRTAAAEEVAAAFAVRGPDPADPASLWSVDLCFRYLPSVHERAQRVSPEDALVLALRQLSAAWPLSGVGVPGASRGWLTSRAAGAVRASDCLRGLLVDRVMSSGDAEAAEIDWIADEIARAAGAFPELLPALWKPRHG
jgi:hypothetical protein